MEKKQKNEKGGVGNLKKKQKEKILMIIFGVVVGLIAGVYLGMLTQQMILGALAVEVAEGLEGANIEVNVDLNETQIIEGVRETFIPIFNQTIQEIKEAEK